MMQQHQQQFIRYPRLDTLLMIERSIKKYDGEFTRTQLWKRLPKKVMYPTFSMALEYLFLSKKISIDAEGKVGWIFYPATTAQWMKYQQLFVH